MNVLSVATLDIPEAMLNLLAQALMLPDDLMFWCIFHISPCTFLLVLITLATYFETCLNDRRPEGPQELMGLVDIYYSSSSFSKVLRKMADIDIDPFGDHESRPEEPTGENNCLTPGGGSTWEPEREHETSFGGESQRNRLLKDYVKDLYQKLSERREKPQKLFILIISNS